VIKMLTSHLLQLTQTIAIRSNNHNQIITTYLCYCPFVYKWPYDGFHVLVQLLQHIWLSEVHWRAVVLIQAVGYGIMAPYKPQTTTMTH